jgi:RNAse (barnase) inhibitor barstar
MNRIVIDGLQIDSKEALFRTLREQLGEDRMTGSNLDALHDVLTSITVHTIIEVWNESELKDSLGDYWKKVLWMLNDCLDENENIKLVNPISI